MDSESIDVTAAHKHFAAHCFNSAWDLIEKANRTPEEDRLMLALNQASIYHWLSRSDCTDENLSVGYWQASRIQSLLKNGVEAARHAEVCLGYSNKLPPFYVGYAYEALARAAMLAGEQSKAELYLSKASEQAALIESADDRSLLLADLESIPPGARN